MLNIEKEQKKKGTKERIRDVAIDLFSQKGYNAVSIRDIARLVKIHESSIYSHYKGKEDIMDSIITSLIEAFNIPAEINLGILPDEYDPQTLINDATMPMIEQLKNPFIRKIMRLMCIELYHNDKILDFFKNQYIEPSYTFWSHVFQKMMDQGYIREYDADLLSREFFSYCIYLLFEIFLFNYNETEYNSLIDDIMNKLSNHIKFIFDMIGLKESKD